MFPLSIYAPELNTQVSVIAVIVTWFYGTFNNLSNSHRPACRTIYVGE